MTSPQSGTLESLAMALASLLAPLEERLAQGNIRALFAELGVQFPPALDSIDMVNDTAQHLADNAIQLLPKVRALIAAIEAEDAGQILSLSFELVDLVSRTIRDINQLATAIQNASGATGLPPADVAAFAAELPARLLDYLIVTNLERVPGLVETLDFIGAVDRTQGNVGSVDPAKPPYTRRELHVDRLIDFISDPVDRLQALYGWDTPGFTGVDLLSKLETILTGAGMPAILDASVNPPVLDIFFIELRPATDLDPKGLRTSIAEAFTIRDEGTFTQDDFSIETGFDAEFKVGTEITFQPNDNIQVKPPSGDFKGDAFVQLTAGKPDGTPYIILGEPNSSRVETRQFRARVGAGFAWKGNHAEGEFIISAEIRNGKILIGTEEGDGFLTSILSGIKVESEFDLGLGFSSKDGLFFIGSSTLQVQIPLHVALGFVDINALTLGVGLSPDGFPMSLAVDIKAALGPLHAVVEQIGIEVLLNLPSNRDGNLGIVDFSLGFKPPTGVGLAIDAGVVKGGGFLRFDPDKEEYDGILELDLSGIISVKAIGLITTRMPDGSKGFSLLLIITAEFGTPIQLGFGFTLSGVGGLLGLNRTMRLEVIATGIRDGGINSVMFPQNVIENAPRIISDLKKYFPVEEGTFLIGPMVKIGWGTPNLVTVSMGIIIEIPGNIAILGVLKVVLPDEAAPLIVIQVNFIGAIEFDKSRLWFFAAIFESRILYITLEGEMGLLVGWGDEPAFVVSVGGFHPAFNPPPLPFGAIARIAISILNTDFARIRVTAYFAVTSNSVQFGAAAELYFGLSAFKIDGHLSFDALFRFSPFYFIITISASLSVKVFGVGLFSVRMRGSLEGPTPWHVAGTGSISFFFFDIDVDFSHTWGNEEETTLPPIAVAPLLVSEFQKLENWLAVLPASNKLLVSIRNMEAGTVDLILHPVGGLKISQRAVPLGLTIDKVGNQKPSDANLFNVSVAGLEEKDAVEESFAIGQFFDKSDDELLSAKSFEPLKGGVELSVSGSQYRTPKAVKRVVRYEKIIIDTLYKRFVKKFFPWVGILFNLFANGSSVTLSPLSNKQQKQLKPFADKVQIGKTLYVVAHNEDNTPYQGNAIGFTSQALAQEYMSQQVAIDGNLAKQLHVIPQVEMQRTG